MRLETCLANPFDEARLAGMGHADRVEPGPELVRLALAGRQVAEVHKQFHRRIVALRLLRGNEVLDLVPQSRLTSGNLVEVLRLQDRRLSLTSRLLLCSLLGRDPAVFFGAARASPSQSAVCRLPGIHSTGTRSSIHLLVWQEASETRKEVPTLPRPEIPGRLPHRFSP